MGNEVPISGVKKRGFLRQAAEQAKASALTLRETLLATQKGQFTPTLAGGRIIVSQSGSGQSGSFEISANGKEWTPDNVFALVEQLIEVCDDCIADGNADEAGQPDTLFAAMIADARLSGVRSQMGDFTSLRC